MSGVGGYVDIGKAGIERHLKPGHSRYILLAWVLCVFISFFCFLALVIPYGLFTFDLDNGILGIPETIKIGVFHSMSCTPSCGGQTADSFGAADGTNAVGVFLLLELAFLTGLHYQTFRYWQNPAHPKKAWAFFFIAAAISCQCLIAALGLTKVIGMVSAMLATPSYGPGGVLIMIQYFVGAATTVLLIYWYCAVRERENQALATVVGAPSSPGDAQQVSGYTASPSGGGYATPAVTQV